MAKAKVVKLVATIRYEAPSYLLVSDKTRPRYEEMQIRKFGLNEALGIRFSSVTVRRQPARRRPIKVKPPLVHRVKAKRGRTFVRPVFHAVEE